jgi:heat shock protein HtpX
MEQDVPIVARPIEQRNCPRCRALIPVYADYVTWCEQCGWNLRPQTPGRSRSIFETLYTSMGQKFSRQLFDEVVKTPTLAPTLNLSIILAVALSAVVHTCTLAFALLGATILIKGWPNVVLIGLGLLCAGIAWSIRPRLSKMPDAIVARDRFPTLYKVVDQVAEAIGTSSVAGIVIDSRFNAAFGQHGWRRKRVLYLGLPLFAILAPQECIALIAHELAHGANGDPNRGLVVGSAVASLTELYLLLRPDTATPSRSHTPVKTIAGPLNQLAAIPADLFMRAISVIPWLGALALSHLLWHEQQRAEYLADQLAATASGTDAALGMLEKLHFDSTFHQAVQKVSLGQNDQSLFDVLQLQVAQMPTRELERIRRVERLQASRLDVTHPPTAYRIDLLKARPVPDPKVTLLSTDAEQIERELMAVHKGIQRELVDQHKRRLYY